MYTGIQAFTSQLTLVACYLSWFHEAPLHGIGHGGPGKVLEEEVLVVLVHGFGAVQA